MITDAVFMQKECHTLRRGIPLFTLSHFVHCLLTVYLTGIVHLIFYETAFLIFSGELDP